MTGLIKTYYEEHNAVFNEKFQIALEGFDMEAIHKMRTSTKRLRALFILIEFLTDKKFKAKKQLKKIRSLFKFAGMIRELQIEKQLITEHETILDENFQEYLEYLTQREHKEISRFLKHLPALKNRKNIINSDKVLKAIDSVPEHKAKSRTLAFISDKEKEISSIKSKPDSNHRIHSNRTHLKQVYYLHEILIHMSEREKILGISALRLREMEQYLGKWHDLVNSPVYMNAFFKTRRYKGEEKYKILKKRIADDRKKMRQEIVKSFYPELKV